MRFFFAIVFMSLLSACSSGVEHSDQAKANNNEVRDRAANNSTDVYTDAASIADQALAAANSASKPAEKTWEYKEYADKMRGSVDRFASIESKNTVYFDFPYNGGSLLSLIIRDTAKDGEDIILQISKGQFLCSYSGCSAVFKFDDGAMDKVPLVQADGGSADVLFLSGDKEEIIKKIKKSKILLIEVEFYQSGARQFEFDVHGLKW